jgi:hypothetical protein
MLEPEDIFVPDHVYRKIYWNVLPFFCVIAVSHSLS